MCYTLCCAAKVSLMSTFYRGVGQGQDPRFRNASRTTVAARAWPDFVRQGMRVTSDQVKGVSKWVEERVKLLLGYEDEITANYIVSALTGETADVAQVWLNVESMLGDQTRILFEQLHRFLSEIASPQGEAILQQLVAEKSGQEAALIQLELDMLRKLRKVFDEYDPPTPPSSPDSIGLRHRRTRKRRKLSH